MLKNTTPLPDTIDLGMQDSVSSVYCGTVGLKVFSIKNPYQPALLSTKTDGDFVDVIPYDGTLICFVKMVSSGTI